MSDLDGKADISVRDLELTHHVAQCTPKQLLLTGVEHCGVVKLSEKCVTAFF